MSEERPSRQLPLRRWTAGKIPLAADNLQDQFVVFQMNPKAEGPTILESSQVAPLIDGSPEELDVLTSLERLYENSRDKAFDTLYWSIAGPAATAPSRPDASTPASARPTASWPPATSARRSW